MSDIICFYNFANNEKESGCFMLEQNVELAAFKQYLVESNIMEADQVLLDCDNHPLESEEVFHMMKTLAHSNDTPMSITITSPAPVLEDKESPVVESEPLSEEEPFGPALKQLLTTFNIDYQNITQLDDIIERIPFPFSLMARGYLTNIKANPNAIEQIVQSFMPGYSAEISPLIKEVTHAFAFFDRKDRERAEEQARQEREAQEQARQEELARQAREEELIRLEKEAREQEEKAAPKEREFIGPAMRQIMEKTGIELEVGPSDVPILLEYIPFPYKSFVTRAIGRMTQDIHSMDYFIRSFAQKLGVSENDLVEEVHYAFNRFQEVAKEAETEKVEEKEEEKVVRHPAICDSCNVNITGIRYKCLHCADYDLCTACEEKNIAQCFHDESHVFAKIHNPTQSLPFSRVFRHPAAMYHMRMMHQARHPAMMRHGPHRQGPHGVFNRITQLEASVEELKKAVAALAENKM